VVHPSGKLLPANDKSANPVVLGELKGLFSYEEGSYWSPPLSLGLSSDLLLSGFQTKFL